MFIHYLQHHPVMLGWEISVSADFPITTKGKRQQALLRQRAFGFALLHMCQQGLFCLLNCFKFHILDFPNLVLVKRRDAQITSGQRATQSHSGRPPGWRGIPAVSAASSFHTLKKVLSLPNYRQVFFLLSII